MTIFNRNNHTNRLHWPAALVGGIITAASLAHAAPAAELDTALLPAPVFEAEPGYVDLYWKARELAREHGPTGAVYAVRVRIRQGTSSQLLIMKP